MTKVWEVEVVMTSHFHYSIYALDLQEGDTGAKTRISGPNLLLTAGLIRSF